MGPISCNTIMFFCWLYSEKIFYKNGQLVTLTRLPIFATTFYSSKIKKEIKGWKGNLIWIPVSKRQVLRWQSKLALEAVSHKFPAVNMKFILDRITSTSFPLLSFKSHLITANEKQAFNVYGITYEENNYFNHFLRNLFKIILDVMLHPNVFSQTRARTQKRIPLLLMVFMLIYAKIIINPTWRRTNSLSIIYVLFKMVS